MVEVRREVDIEQPIEVVFDFLADGTNNPRWQPHVVETILAGQQQGAGDRYRQSVRHPLGFKVSADYRVTEFERPRLLQFEVTSGGPIRPTGVYELIVVGPARTRVRFTLRYQPRGAMTLLPLMPVVRLLFSREVSWIERAKSALETPRS